MHDPLVVAFEIPFPWPVRWRFADAKRPGERRWTFGRRRRTNPENLGEPIYPWWRPKAWQPRIAGRVFRLARFITVWHREPGGADSGEVCKWWRTNRRGERVVSRRWAWHVWHWRIQVIPAQKLRRFLFERCILCGRRYPWNYAPVSHQWDGPGSRWFRVNRLNYHHECSGLVSLRRERETDEALIRHLFAALRVTTDESEPELLAKLTDPKSRGLDFLPASRLTRLLGFERDDDYKLVRSGGRP